MFCCVGIVFSHALYCSKCDVYANGYSRKKEKINKVYICHLYLLHVIEGIDNTRFFFYKQHFYKEDRAIFGRKISIYNNILRLKAE